MGLWGSVGTALDPASSVSQFAAIGLMGEGGLGPARAVWHDSPGYKPQFSSSQKSKIK